MDEMKYRPGEMSDAARDELTVGREEIIEDAIGHIRSSCDQRSKHHFLFLGPRGIGKTHLLACIQDRIRRDPELDEKITLVVFPEEAIATLSFASFLTKLAQLISQQLPSETEWSAALSGIESLKTLGQTEPNGDRRPREFARVVKPSISLPDRCRGTTQVFHGEQWLPSVGISTRSF